MKNKIIVEIEVEHDDSSTTQEICDGLILLIEGINPDRSEPDDFGITKTQVVLILCDDKKV